MTHIVADNIEMVCEVGWVPDDFGSLDDWDEYRATFPDDDDPVGDEYARSMFDPNEGWIEA